jgi:AcrR family transcriptional regulator
MADPPTAGLIWTRSSRSTRTARAVLDRDTVVRAAIEILDGQGIDGLSMRKLGDKLGAAPTTLYWHVSSKDELLDIAFDEVMRELPDMHNCATGDWRADVRSALDELHAMMFRHRWYPALFSTRPSIGPNALRFWGGLLDVLGTAGLANAQLDNAFCMLSDYVIGSAAIHISYDSWLRSNPADIEATHAYVRESVRPYRTYAKYIDQYIAKTDAPTRRDRRYAYALDCMLDGLGRQIDQAAARPRRGGRGG